jgi:serine protease
MTKAHAARLAIAAAVLALAPAPRVAEAAVPAPNDPNFPKQWNLPLIQIPDAWSVSRGEGVIVAVLDSGVAYEDFDRYRRAPDLAGTRFAPGKDLIDGDDHPNDDVDPTTLNRPAHGTHSAGIIAQTTDNGLGQAGVAPGATLMPVRVLGPGGEGTDEQIAAGILFAVDHGAQVLSMSFDSPTDRPGTRAAVAYAASKGVTMVAAVGNNGRAPVGFPAAYPEVIAVGAVRFDKTRATYSSFGGPGDVDLVAPGGDMSVDQNGDGAPDGILSNSMLYGTNSFGDIPVDGTSAAAPHVAGVAALLIGSGLATTPAQVRRALEDSALDLGPSGPDIFTGAGLVQARAALTAAGAPPPEREPGAAAPTPGQDQSTPGGARWALVGGAAGVIMAAGAGTAVLRRRRGR